MISSLSLPFVSYQLIIIIENPVKTQYSNSIQTPPTHPSVLLNYICIQSIYSSSNSHYLSIIPNKLKLSAMILIWIKVRGDDDSVAKSPPNSWRKYFVD